MRFRSIWGLALFLFALGFAAVSAGTAQTGVVFDRTCVLRQYYCFGLNRYSVELLKSDGEKVLGRTVLEREKRAVMRWMQQEGMDPNTSDWREHACLSMGGGARAFVPKATPAPPADWMQPDFDDQGWVRKRGPFQSGRGVKITAPVLGQFDETMDLRLQRAYYRARFQVVDPARAGALALHLVYSGGVRVFVNGIEIARGHLPAGQLADDTPAEPYPAAAYQPNGAQLRNRAVAGLVIPRDKLRSGINVLAIENRASHFHPVVMTFPTQPNWGGPMRPWPHAKLTEIQLRGAGELVPSLLKRPTGVQVWVEDIHHRIESDEFLPVGEAPGTLRMVGARGGTHAAQIAIGTDADLSSVEISASVLRQVNGPATLPADTLKTRHLVPYPADRFTLEELGDERGLAAKFPSLAQLAVLEATDSSAQVCLFDHLVEAGSGKIPANSARPVWLTARIPNQAVPGIYRGEIEAKAAGKTLARVPVELEIFGWELPPPRDFKAFVGCEQNPYGVARQYGVKPWTDPHFALMEASFRELGRLGNRWLNVPILRETEFGNRDDSMVRWIQNRDGSIGFDFRTLDRYLDLAVKYWGPQKVVCLVVMHGMPPRAQGNVKPEVTCLDERTGRPMALQVGGQGLPPELKRARWQAFARAAFDHLKSRNLQDALWWGYPLEGEADPELKQILATATPEVHWIAGPHEMMANGTFAKDERYYRLVADIRYHGKWPSFRDDQGWKSKTLHLNNPRAGGTCIALHTTTLPFGYRLLADRCLAMGRNGFTRVGADEWGGIHYEGMIIPQWLTGLPVLFTLWPGTNGAEPSVRHEILLEGIQEAEARIYLEQALDRGALRGELQKRVRATLAENFNETTFLQGNSIVQAFYQNHYRWQERSRRLYLLAAEVAAVNP